jgi:hypothetical protein
VLCCTHVRFSCLSRLIVVEDVQPDPIVEVIPQHQRSVPTALPSPPHHQQQQYPQHHSKYPQQQQQQQLHQHPDNHHIQSLHRQTEMKTSSIRTGAPNSDSSQNTRSTTSSTVVYCSQPNMLGNSLFLYIPVCIYSQLLVLFWHVSPVVCPKVQRS